MIEIDPIERYDIYEILELYENLYNTIIYTNYFIKYPKLKSRENKILHDFYLDTRKKNFSKKKLLDCLYFSELDLYSLGI